MIGQTFRMQVADSYATYEVTAEGRFVGPYNVDLVYVEPARRRPEYDYAPAPPFGDGCWIEARVIRAYVARKRALDELFGGRST